MNWTRKTAVAATVAVGVLLAPSTAAQRQEHAPLSDDAIRHLVEHELDDRRVEGVSVTVENGEIVLRGRVPSVWHKNQAVEAALAVPHVEAVESEIVIERERSDEDLAAMAGAHVNSYVFYTLFDEIVLEVNQGVVTVRGRVTEPYKADEIAERVARVRGVQDVRNEIRVLPPSPNDMQLRANLASRLFRDPAFWEYANRVRPPIHIVVENGRVTLTGNVRNNVEKRRAEHIARGTFGVLSVENQLTIRNKST